MKTIQELETRIAEVERARDSLKDELYSAGLLTGWSLSKSAREREELTQQVATLTTQHDAALARVKELEEDGKLLDWIWEFIKENGLLSIQRWDHDGRRFLGRTLLVHTFAERGGENETLRAAIRTAMTETGGGE